MSPTFGFLFFLGVTLLLLGVVFATGLKARRALHLPSVALAVIALGATIYFAEQLGELYDLETAGWVTPVHLALAKTTVVAYALPVLTGVLTIRRARWRKLHGKLAWLVLALTVLTAATGTAMVLLSDPLPLAGEAAPAFVEPAADVEPPVHGE